VVHHVDQLGVRSGSEKTTEVTAALFQNRALGPQDQIEAYE
jgi:hypothetical protein